jgi:hypothetical protein
MLRQHKICKYLTLAESTSAMVVELLFLSYNIDYEEEHCGRIAANHFNMFPRAGKDPKATEHYQSPNIQSVCAVYQF